VSVPAVSVIIVTYNHGHFVRDAVTSVLAQTWTDFELIVVDDGSTDATAEVLGPFGDRLRYHRQENKGAFAARNTGRGLAHGSLIAFLDADDIWAPEALGRLKGELDARPRAGVAAPTYKAIDASGRETGAVYRRSDPESSVTVESLLLTDADVPGCLYRKEALDAAGPFSEINRYCGDYELWLELAMAWEIVVVDEPLLLKREHTTNLTGEALRMLPAKIAAVDRFRAAHPEWAAQHERLLRRAQSKNHERIAKWCLRTGDPKLRAAAREHLRQAVALNPWRPKLYLLQAKARTRRAATA
jgi:glycosyltransferase involved in cell wall biosynthesis